MPKHMIIQSTLMDKPSSQEGSVRNNSGASKRMVRSKISHELHLLPTDVLRNILSRVSLKDAVRMNALSREWRRLAICHPDLVITEGTFFHTRMAKPRDIAHEFITRVNNVLRPLWSTSTTTTATVDKFVVKFCLNRRHTHQIDRWIDFSTASMAKHIGLDLIHGNGSEDDKYVVPLCKLSGPNGSCVESLDMAYVCLKPPPSFQGIVNLKKLSLQRVSIDASDLQSLLISCGLLESLSLECCPLSSGLSVCQELPKLQYLSVCECSAGLIQLQAPNLTTVQLYDSFTQIMLSESTKLSEATFVFKNSSYDSCSDPTDYILTALPTSLPYVHALFLHMVVEYKVQTFTKCQATFLNLRQLNLNIHFIDYNEDNGWDKGVINVLESAPLLEELELHIDPFRLGLPDRTVRAAPGPLHHHLRIVHITGFCDFEGIAELALYILGNATVLERMIVDPVIRMYYAYPYTGLFYSVHKSGSRVQFVRASTEEEQHDREFAKKHLDREEFRHILTIL